jgi:hypothetical protein
MSPRPVALVPPGLVGGAPAAGGRADGACLSADAGRQHQDVVGAVLGVEALA